MNTFSLLVLLEASYKTDEPSAQVSYKLMYVAPAAVKYSKIFLFICNVVLNNNVAVLVS